MGGKGRGIFSDFRMSRVSRKLPLLQIHRVSARFKLGVEFESDEEVTSFADKLTLMLLITVYVPDVRLGWSITGREKGELVVVCRLFAFTLHTGICTIFRRCRFHQNLSIASICRSYFIPLRHKP